jgi:hypothetical protein
VKIVMLVAFALVITSCEKTAEPNNPPSPSNDVELLSSGSEPRQLLRYRLIKGTTSPLELAMDLDLDAAGRGGKLPTLIMSLSIKVDDALPDGNFKIKTTVEKARVQDREGSAIPLAAVANMTQMLTGMTYTATLSPDGTLRDAKIVSSHAQTMASELSQFTQGLEQLAMRMPAVPVGVGAKWSSRKSTTQNELALTTVTTIAVTAIDGDRVSFASTSTVSAPDQTVKQGAITTSIRDIGGGGSGTGVVDLSKMTMAGEVSAEFRGTMLSQGSAGNLRIAMKMLLK